MTRIQQPRFWLGVVGLVHVTVTALAWRDISVKTPSELRGSKNVWRWITALNTGTALIYLAVGRRRRATPDAAQPSWPNACWAGQ